MKIISRLFKIILALLLLPFCVGSVMALWQIILKNGSVEMIWTAILAGATFWILIYLFLPEPKWIYVLGHELTHALWSFFFGGKLKKLKVKSDGGHVLITKSNFLTTLAPYFFPLYTVLVMVFFSIGNLFWNWNKYILLFYFLIGITYAFHVTLTKSILKIKQPDIIHEGYIFSAVIIFLGNTLVLLIGISFLTAKVNISTALNMWLDYSFQAYRLIYSFLSHSVS